MTVQIARTADDPKQGMTVCELRKLIEEADRAGINDGARVKADIGFRGQVKRAEVSG